MQADPQRDEKIRRLLAGLSANEAGLDLLRTTLAELGHRLMPRVEFMTLPEVTDATRLAMARTGIILDTETTGLNPAEDKVIQLSMLHFTYDEQGIIKLGDLFDAYQDPGMPIPEEVTRITGITQEMVDGRSIDEAEVSDFISGVDMVVAHNAGFDRKFIERAFPGASFAQKDWHCSIEQIDWPARGERRGTLEMLALKAGFVYDAHNSRSDILATAFVLANEMHEAKPSPFVEMLSAATLAPHHIIALGSPFHAKEDLKARGYRWAGDDEPVCGHRKVWHRVIPGTPEAMAEEAKFLDGIFGSPKNLPMFAYDGKTRYSERPPARTAGFCTRTNLSLWERMQIEKDAPCGVLNAQGTLDI